MQIYKNDEKLEMYIRKKLGQNFDNPQYNKNDRPKHLRIKMGACNCICENCKSENIENHCNYIIYKKNKKICELFKDDFNSYRLVIYVWKGLVCSYLVSNRNYKKYDYWNEINWFNGINEHLNLPYKYCNLTSGEGTIDIIKHLIKISHMMTNI